METVEIVETGETVKIVESVETVGTVEIVEPGDSAEIGETVEIAEIEEIVETVETVETVGTVEIVEPGDSVETVAESVTDVGAGETAGAGVGEGHRALLIFALALLGAAGLGCALCIIAASCGLARLERALKEGVRGSEEERERQC